MQEPTMRREESRTVVSEDKLSGDSGREETQCPTTARPEDIEERVEGTYTKGSLTDTTKTSPASLRSGELM